MTKKLKFIFGVHCHQPVGNFDFVFEKAVKRSYAPFLNILEKHPSVSCSIHYTGCLLEWLVENHSLLVEKMKTVGSRDNIEIVSGAFYEPILSVISDYDKIGQIKKMNDFVHANFSQTVRGMWLAERVWEPHLAKPISEAGIEYTVLDDFHFLSAGMPQDKIFGYFETEEIGHPLKIFPIQQELRYLIPFHPVEEVIGWFRGFQEKHPGATVVMMDDGEKFGLWPRTYDHCYKNGWLEEFFTALEENSDWLETTTFSKVLDSEKSQGKVYLPTGSYFEMGQWAIPSEQGRKLEQFSEQLKQDNLGDFSRPFVKGGHWRNFLSKYPESARMRKRVLDVAKRIEKNGKSEDLQDDVWRAMCNCSYWHGIFGGLYLPHLRNGIYDNLICAEEKYYKNDTAPKVEKNGVGLVLSNESMRAFLNENGEISEIDSRKHLSNLTNTLSRYPESYHEKVGKFESNDGIETIHSHPISKEKGLEKLLHFDEFERLNFQDFMVPKNVSMKTFFENGIHLKPLEYVNQNEAKFSCLVDNLSAAKRYKISEKGIVVNYDISAMKNTIFGTALNLFFPGGQNNLRINCVNSLKKRKKFSGKNFILRDEWREIEMELKFSEDAKIWYFPIETVSLSESGFEKIFQGFCLFPHWKISGEHKFKIELRIK